jgi:hypothetical protein
MARKGSTLDREKVNFMISRVVVADLRKTIPEGERSDFVNEALQAAMDKIRLKQFSEGLDTLRNADPRKFSNKEIIQAIHEGRK